MAPTQPVGTGLREVALKSGAYLAGREALGVGIRLAGLVLVVREIGTSAFGIYSGAASFCLFGAVLAQMGAEVFLVRLPGPVDRRRYDEVFTFLLCTSLVVVALGEALSFAVGTWLRPVGVVVPLRVLLLTIPVNILWAPAQASIERRFAYRRMGLLELGGDVVLYGVAVPLAFSGAGAWSLIVGFAAWQAYLLVGSMALSEVRPTLAWSWATSRAMLTHGVTYSLTTWIFGLRSSIVTLVVGAFAGATGVGYVNFAQRLVMTMNFTDRGVHRIGMVTISQASTERRRLAPALEEGTLLLMFVAALPFVAFALVARWAIPAVFGAAWLPALPIYVLLSIWAILRVPSTVQRTLLYAYGRNYPPAVTSAIELVLASVVSIVTIHAIGIVGYGVATVVGVVSTANTHRAAQRLVPMRLRRVAVPLAGCVPALLMPLVPLPWSLLLLSGPMALLAHPGTRREIQGLVRTARSTVSRRMGRRRTPEPIVPPVAVAGVAMLPPVHPVDAARAPIAGSWEWPGAPGPLDAVAVPSGRDAEMSRNGTAAGSGRGRSLPTLAGHWLDSTDVRPADMHLADVQDGDSAAGDLHGASSEPVVAPGGEGGSDPGLPERVWGNGTPSTDRLASVDPLADLLQPDPVTGLPAAGVLLARIGRLLGAARRGGWFLVVVALDVGSGAGGALTPPPERSLAAVAAVLRAELRFDDPVARVGPSTFVVAVPLAPGAAPGAAFAAHLETSVGAVLCLDAAESVDRHATRGGRTGGSGVRVAHTIIPLPSEEDADQLVRRVVDAVHR